MNANKKSGLFSTFKNDFPASIVVFLVALPLCMAIAIASGAEAFAGIIAGIVGGIVVGLISKSPLGVSGPAAGLAVIVDDSIAELSSFNIFLIAVVIGGLLQMLMGFLRAGVIGYFFPSSVIKGMLAGIGVVIAMKQINEIMGSPVNDLGQFSDMLASVNTGAIVISAISLGILILWEQKFIKKMPVIKLVPGPLLVVLVGIGLALFFQGNSNMALGSNIMVSVPEADSLSGFFSNFSFPKFSALGDSDYLFPILKVSVIIALVASIETLLCVEATDKLDPQKRITPTNRELIAQGAGNMLSGFVGGLPVTQVIVRSSANINSGGKTKMSAIIHGFLLLICVMTIPGILNLIPMASLGVILIVVGYKLAKPALFKEMYQKGWGQLIPFLATILGIVFLDLLKGVGIGLAIGIVQILVRNYKIPYVFRKDEFDQGKPIHLELSENVSFLNKASIMNTLKKIPNNASLIVDATKASKVDSDVLEILDEFKQTIEERNIQLEFIGFSKEELGDPVKTFNESVANQGSMASESQVVQ